MYIQVVAQTTSDDSMKLPADNGSIALVPKASLSTPVMSAKVRHICTYKSLVAWQDTTGDHGDTWIIVCYLWGFDR